MSAIAVACRGLLAASGALLLTLSTTSVVSAQEGAASATPTAAFIPPQTFSRTLGKYPPEALKHEVQGAYLVQVFVDPSGKPYQCKILGTVGSDTLSEPICQEFRLMRMEPARLSDGTPAYGYFKTLLKYMLPDNSLADEIQETREDPDIELEVNRLPEGKQSYDFKLVAQFSEDGTIESCLSQETVVAAYTRAACQQAGSVQWPSVTDREGKQVVFVRVISVKFAVKAPAGAPAAASSGR